MFGDYLSDPDGVNNSCKYNLAAIIISASHNDSTQRTAHKNWLAWFGGLTI